MCDPITATIIGGSILGGGLLGADTGRRASNQAEDAQKRQEAQMAEERRLREAALDREFTANTATYDKRMGYLDKLIADPSIHPDYAQFKTQTEKAGQSSLATLKDTLRRRGLTGGAQDKILQDVTGKVGGSLAEALAGTKLSAEKQSSELPTPYRGMGQYILPGTPSFPQTQMPDFSGLGMTLALLSRGGGGGTGDLGSLGTTGSTGMEGLTLQGGMPSLDTLFPAADPSIPYLDLIGG